MNFFKKSVTIFAWLILVGQLTGQCDFEVTVEGDLLLCPESEGTLFTHSFDSYQWYKRPFSGGGQPEAVSGATDSFLVVDYFSDVPAWFSVEVTLDTCTVRSDEVLLDGYVFLPPFVETIGEFSVGPDGETILCNNDTVLFVFSMDTNIQWYRNFEAIPGATDRELLVWEAGSYYAEGAPFECPDFVVNLGLFLEVVKRDVDAEIPVIFQLLGDTLILTNEEEFVFWEWYCVDYFSQELTFISQESSISWDDYYDICKEGPILVRSIDRNGCVVWSDEFYITINSVADNDIGLKRIFPNPASNVLMVELLNTDSNLEFRLYDVSGKFLRTYVLSDDTSVELDISDLMPGIYLLSVSDGEMRTELKFVKK